MAGEHVTKIIQSCLLLFPNDSVLYILSHYLITFIFHRYDRQLGGHQRVSVKIGVVTVGFWEYRAARSAPNQTRMDKTHKTVFYTGVHTNCMRHAWTVLKSKLAVKVLFQMSVIDSPSASIVGSSADFKLLNKSILGSADVEGSTLFFKESLNYVII